MGWQQGNKATRQQGNKATRQQGNKATRQQGNKATKASSVNHQASNNKVSVNNVFIIVKNYIKDIEILKFACVKKKQ